MLVHSNAKPFSCTHCSETFKERRNVVKHIKLKHLSKKLTSEPHIESETHTHDNEEPGELKSKESGLNETNKDSEDLNSTECMDTSADSETMSADNEFVLNEIEQPDSTEPTE